MYNLKFHNDPSAKKEKGNMIDNMASILVMIMIFVMITAMVSYGRLVMIKLSVDNTVRNYLYISEQQGYLSPDDIANMTRQLAVTLDIREDAVDTSGTTITQVPYGDPVSVVVTVNFTNPLFKNLGITASNGRSREWFGIESTNPTKNYGAKKIAKTLASITYTTSYTSTARW